MHKLILNILCLFRRATKADIVKVFSFTAVSTLVKMLTSLVSVKVVAFIIGPSGVALVGQLNNFASIIMSLSSGGINNGITKYVAEYKDDNDKIKGLFSTALRITVICSFIIGILLISLNSFLSKYIMLSSDYSYVFIVFGFTVLLYALNMMLTSIINGFKEFKKYVEINIANSIIGLLFTLSFVFTLGLKGALISAVSYQSMMFFVTLWMIRKIPWVNWEYFKGKVDITILKKYFRYTMMTMATAMTVPVSQMLLRGYVISEISSIEAGWWEAMNRISNLYLMVITTSFSVYYLPKLSELSTKQELRREILRAYQLIIPILLISFLAIYILRFFIINILFTSDFLPMERLFIWQLLGDFFKICSWLLAFLMVAKSMTKVFVSTEIFFSLSFVLLSFLFIQRNGIIGITQAYMFNSILYLIFMLILFRSILFVR